METVYVKNMVCQRCVMVVGQLLQQVGAAAAEIRLGEIDLARPMSLPQRDEFKHLLQEAGFEWIDDKKSRLIAQMKAEIVRWVHYTDRPPHVNLSEWLSRTLNCDYSYLSGLFSEVEGTTIEKYFILQKVEKVKELLVYDELTLSEIAFQLHYSSAAHLSSQFKKVTGLTPSHFKQIKENRRLPLDKV